MLQEFFKTTLISKFIKQLLAKSPVPIYKLIYDNDEMVEGCVYTYKDKILKCTKSGRFLGTRGTLERNDYLYVQHPLMVNEGNMTVTRYVYDDKIQDYKYELTEVPFSVTDDVVNVKLYKPAEFDVVATLTPDTYNPGQTEVFISNSAYYDEETHQKLGEYLRYLNNLYDLDLMPLYNCFNYKTVDDIGFEFIRDPQGNLQPTITQHTSRKMKTYLVPIKFDKTYTVALDSDFPVRVKAVLYNNGLIPDLDTGGFLTGYINESVTQYNSTRFSQPFTYKLENTQIVRSVEGVETSYYAKLHEFERYLYLAIQVTADNDSSIVVLEGDYSHLSETSVTDVMSIEKAVNTADAVSSMLTSRLSLLEHNDKQQHPFADKLIQYLLRNTIDTREYIDENVARIETAVDYRPVYKGLWDDNLRFLLFDRYMKLKDKEELNFTDILGYVDSDIEHAVRKGYLDSGYIADI